VGSTKRARGFGGGFVRLFLPPVVMFLVFVAIWHFYAAGLRIGNEVIIKGHPPYLVPTPVAVLRAARENFGTLVSATLLTATGSLAGFALSLVIGTIVAFLFSQSVLIQRAAYPYAIFLQTVPIVAIAPLIILWFGHGFAGIMVTAFIVSLFPIITNGTAGLTSLDRDAVELFEVNNATRWQLLWKLRLPNAVPNLITGAKTASGLSVIGGIVGEFFAGYGSGRFGLGYYIFQTSAQLKTAALFAAIISSTMLGWIAFGVVSLIGNRLTSRWRER
jgi:NitT/TauT family transport system permease protein